MNGNDPPLERFIAKIAGSLYTAVLSDVLDDLAPCDVVVLGCGGSRRIAPWVELLTIASRAGGAVGCVTDGYVRDVRAIRSLGFPVFHAEYNVL